MQLQYSLSKRDFLILYLFSASKSAEISKKRKKNKINIFFLYLAIGMVAYILGYAPLAIIFSISALLWLWFFPKYERKKYIKYYNNYIDNNLQDRIGEKVLLNITSDAIQTKDSISETEIKTSDLSEINEITQYFFFHFHSGESLIIPKNELDDTQNIQKYFEKMAKKEGIKFNRISMWKWK